MAGKQSYKTIEAVRKTCEILIYLGNQKEPSTGLAVAAAVGLPAGTVMCHLVTLQEKGFVQQVGGAWQLGMALALLWARKKAELEGARDRIINDLERIGA
jgi:DNA-binding IclR family transcriptional regulator